ncbi:MAG: hypothetical protein WC028_16645 [Candidatus Obscuribacterales bacterium]
MTDKQIEKKTPGDHHYDGSTALFADAYKDFGGAFSGLTKFSTGLAKLGAGVVLAEKESVVVALDFSAKVGESVATGVAGAVVNTVKSAANEVEVLNKENPEIKQAARGFGDAFGASLGFIVSASKEMSNRDIAYHQSRPETAKLLAPAFGLDHLAGVLFGGLEPEAKAKPDQTIAPAKAAEQPAVQARAAEQSTTIDSGASYSIVAKAGDSYWKIAKQDLVSSASNAEIAAKVEQLQQLNGNRALFAGGQVKLG